MNININEFYVKDDELKGNIHIYYCHEVSKSQRFTNI